MYVATNSPSKTNIALYSDTVGWLANLVMVHRTWSHNQHIYIHKIAWHAPVSLLYLFLPDLYILNVYLLGETICK